MQFNQIEELVIEILQEANQSFLFPYQIFKRIKQRNPSLGTQIENTYPAATPDRPIMGKGAGSKYSPASFVAHALNSFCDHRPQLRKEWLDATDIVIEDISASGEDGMSIWAWNNGAET